MMSAQDKQQEEEEEKVPYENLVIMLKEQNQALKKMEASKNKAEQLKNKVEERYREKLKETKRIIKEKQVAEDFIKQVLISKLGASEQKTIDMAELDQLLKHHHEIYSKPQAGVQKEGEPVQLLKEENDMLKKKVMDLSNSVKQEQVRNQALQ